MANNIITAKTIANQFKKELGFVNRAALEASDARGELEVIGAIGFSHFHHRRDGQTTIYEIAVRRDRQKEGWGRLLFYRVLCSAIEKKQSSIFLKCPVDNESNKFYQHLGFVLESIEKGRKRQLNCWRYTIKIPLLFYCADGGRNKYSAIAKEEGWRLGLRSDEVNPHVHAEIIDNNFKNYDHQKHLAAIAHHKPLIATAFDIFSEEELPQILEQAKEIAQYCGRVLLIPKCQFAPPSDFFCWWGYSVPSKYGETSVPCSFFSDRPTHLLGGSPAAQAHYSRHLNIVSLDGNTALKAAQWGKSIFPQSSTGEKIVKGCYNSFKLSLKKQKEYWHPEQKWHWSQEPLFQFLSKEEL